MWRESSLLEYLCAVQVRNICRTTHPALRTKMCGRVQNSPVYAENDHGLFPSKETTRPQGFPEPTRQKRFPERRRLSSCADKSVPCQSQRKTGHGKINSFAGFVNFQTPRIILPDGGSPRDGADQSAFSASHFPECLLRRLDPSFGPRLPHGWQPPRAPRSPWVRYRLAPNRPATVTHGISTLTWITDSSSLLVAPNDK